MNSPTHAQDANLISQSLDDGEKLLWHGRPKAIPYALHLQNKWLFLIGIPFLAVGLSYMWMVSQGTAMTGGGGGPHGRHGGGKQRPVPQHDPKGYFFGGFFAAGGMLVVSFPLVRLNRSRRVRYAITNQGALELKLGSREVVVLQDWGYEKPFRFIESGRGMLTSGYIWLGWDKQHKGKPKNDGFVGLIPKSAIIAVSLERSLGCADPVLVFVQHGGRRHDSQAEARS